jgi:hypothetical protein
MKKEKRRAAVCWSVRCYLASASGVELTNAIPNPPAIRAPIIATNLRIKL